MNFPQNFLAAAAGPEDQQFFSAGLDMPLRMPWMGERERMGFVGTYFWKKSLMPSLTPEMSNMLKHQSINATDRGTFLYR